MLKAKITTQERLAQSPSTPSEQFVTLMEIQIRMTPRIMYTTFGMVKERLPKKTVVS